MDLITEMLDFLYKLLETLNVKGYCREVKMGFRHTYNTWKGMSNCREPLRKKIVKY